MPAAAHGKRLTLTFDEDARNLVTARELLTLTYPPFVRFLQQQAARSEGDPREAKYFEENRLGVETLLRAMASKSRRAV